MAALARHMHCPPLLLTPQILSSATPTPRHGGAAHSLAVRPCWAGGQSLRTGKDVNKVSANRSTDALDYAEHEKALKLLYPLDRSVWDLKVNTIIESAGYETLTNHE